MKLLSKILQTTSSQKKQETGQTAENWARQYLEKQGLKFLEARYKVKVGEIDLIMLERQTCLVFVEVRYRKNPFYGTAAASITAHKQHRIKKTAMFYLQQKKLFEKMPCRFDVVTLEGELDSPQFEWLINAF